MLNNDVGKLLMEQDCFSLCRKVEIDGDDWTWSGEEFQTMEAATAKTYLQTGCVYFSTFDQDINRVLVIHASLFTYGCLHSQAETFSHIYRRRIYLTV